MRFDSWLRKERHTTMVWIFLIGFTQWAFVLIVKHHPLWVLCELSTLSRPGPGSTFTERVYLFMAAWKVQKKKEGEEKNQNTETYFLSFFVCSPQHFRICSSDDSGGEENRWEVTNTPATLNCLLLLANANANEQIGKTYPVSQICTNSSIWR